MLLTRRLLPTLRPSARLLAMSSSTASGGTHSTASSSLVMQLIVNRELLEEPGWTMGPMMAQAAHAATAVIAQTQSSPVTQSYVDPNNLASMRKVVLQTTEPLEELSKRLDVASDSTPEFPRHHLWIEEPEHTPTVLAIAPNTRPSQLKKILAKCSLLRG